MDVSMILVQQNCAENYVEMDTVIYIRINVDSSPGMRRINSLVNQHQQGFFLSPFPKILTQNQQLDNREFWFTTLHTQAIISRAQYTANVTNFCLSHVQMKLDDCAHLHCYDK